MREYGLDDYDIRVVNDGGNGRLTYIRDPKMCELLNISITPFHEVANTLICISIFTVSTVVAYNHDRFDYRVTFLYEILPGNISHYT